MTATAPAHIFTDAPITDASGDRLDRGEFSAHVAHRIAAMGGRDSVAFGLTGAWGSGKTSVLRMIADNMPTPEWSVHYFTPWAASDSATLVKEFYATIESALPTDVRKKVGDKLRAMVPLAAGAASMIPVAGKAASTLVEETGKYFEKSFQDQFKEASKDIVEAGIRILVVVDDIDRLHADELVAVLKTVRLLGNFPGIHYLLAYDRNTVLDVLSATSIAKNSDRALQFLEKIVQYPFDLPPLQQSDRVREVTTALAKVEATHSLGPILSGRGPFGSPVDDLLSLVPSGDLETLRAIHRLVTQFDIALTVIHPSEINAVDLLFLTFPVTDALRRFGPAGSNPTWHFSGGKEVVQQPRQRLQAFALDFTVQCLGNLLTPLRPHVAACEGDRPVS
ncbi:KAP family P-loop NTPase fold protein [Rhodococcus opacus]|uniref:KAP family P-loop NTPase fold protein n=1 Tax=Rhodococcus opacus TaxID=37919 RepID=UPI00155B2385|nr:P-loop NTPase fold protein [Rhodococcus opacus]